MTDFQLRIRRFLLTRDLHCASTWEIAQLAFPEKWKRRAARGVLIAHVRRAAAGIPFAHWYGPETQHGCGKVGVSVPTAGRLPDDRAAAYWNLLTAHCVSYAGSAQLGDREYQHIGFTVGRDLDTEAARTFTAARVTQYAAAEATPSADGVAPSDLFRALINTHRVRVVGQPAFGRCYIELWSAYASHPRAEFDPERAKLILLMEHLIA